MRIVRDVDTDMGVIDKMRFLWKWHRLWKNTDPAATTRGCIDNKCEFVYVDTESYDSSTAYICADCSWRFRVKQMLAEAGYREKYLVQIQRGFWHLLWERRPDSVSRSGWLAESEDMIVIHNYLGR